MQAFNGSFSIDLWQGVEIQAKQIQLDAMDLENNINNAVIMTSMIAPRC